MVGREGDKEDLGEKGMCCVRRVGGKKETMKRGLLNVTKCSSAPLKQVVQDHFEGGGRLGEAK